MKPIVHLHQTKDPERFHFVAMPISGGSDREENLTTEEIRIRLAAGPPSTKLFLHNVEGRQVNSLPGLESLGLGDGEPTCRLCHGSGAVGAEACPECSRPWDRTAV